MDSLQIQKAITTSTSPTVSVSSSSPKMTTTGGTSVPLTVRFKPGEEIINDILQSYNTNSGSSGGMASSPSSAKIVTSSPGDNGVGSPGIGVTTGSKGANTLTSNTITPPKISNAVSGNDTITINSVQNQSNIVSSSNTDELNARNTFLQGNYFTPKSGVIGKQQVSPNHLCSTTLDAGTGVSSSTSRSPNSPVSMGVSAGVVVGGGGNIAPIYANCSNNGGMISNANVTISPNKYRRTVSFPIKGATSPIPGYALDFKAGQMSSLHVSNGVPTAGAAGGGDAPYLGTGIGRNVTSGNNPYIGNGMNMRPLDHCLNDILRNMGAVAAGGDNNATAAAILAERIRQHKLNDCDGAGALSTAGNAGDPYLNVNIKLNSPSDSSLNVEHTARFSRKVFVGGLPPDIDEDEITSSFRRFGPLVVDWPHKAESKSYFPPKGYAFLLFQDENSVQQLIDSCIIDDEKLYLCVSSPTIKDKPVQIRPWRLTDADYVLDATMSLDPRKTVFVGGVPRPLKAHELAMIMDRLYGGVCYAGIDTDPELKYPKGAGRVAFSNQQSYIAAISARFVQLQHADIDKRVEVKPYVLDDQLCDECEGQRCGGKFAPFFCANVTCLQYYCEHCWSIIHSRPGREYHKPLVKEGADRPRAVPFRWC